VITGGSSCISYLCSCPRSLFGVGERERSLQSSNMVFNFQSHFLRMLLVMKGNVAQYVVMKPTLLELRVWLNTPNFDLTPVEKPDMSPVGLFPHGFSLQYI